MNATCSRLILLPLVGMATLAYGQANQCTIENGLDAQGFQLRLLGIDPDAPPAAAAAASQDKQISAPAGSASSPDAVSSPDSTRLLALAVDSGLISRASGATTLNLNLFSAIAAMRPAVLEEQEQYARFTTLRRLSGAVTMGGKGDAIDQDLDGTVDDPVVAASAGDILTWEVRYRALGSRDRRDAENYRKVFAALQDIYRSQTRQLGDLALAYGNKHPQQDTYFCKTDVEAFILDAKNQAAIGNYLASERKLTADYDSAVRSVDGSMIVTAVLGGTRRKGNQYGADSTLYGVRASYAVGTSTFDANLDYNAVHRFRDDPKRSSLKFGLSYNQTVLRDLVGHDNEGVILTVAANFEKHRNVPDAAHDKIARANLKLTYPISGTVSLPISITWANHSDLLAGEKEIRGNIGFTYDLGPLFDGED